MGRVGSNSGAELSARAFSIQSCVGMLHQNKHVAREEGLKDLIEALEGFACADDHRLEQALDRCFHFLRSGSAKERKDAYRAIGLYALTVGSKPGQTPLLDRLFDLDRLAGMAPSSPSDAERAVAAIDCLAAVTIACAKLSWEADRALKAIWEVIQQAEAVATPQVLAAAVSAWTVVLPAAFYFDIEEEMNMAPFVLIARLLRANDTDVRMAGGAALAVCIELGILPRQPEITWDYYYYHKKVPEPEPDERPALESRVAELAFGVDARKKAHTAEIALFRQIDDFLKKNELHIYGQLSKKKQGPRESIVHGGCVVKVSGWAKLVRLNFLKYYIGDGFDTHFRLNLPLFRDSLGLTRAAAGCAQKEDLPAHEKKQLRKDLKDKAVRRDLRDKMKQYD